MRLDMATKRRQRDDNTDLRAAVHAEPQPVGPVECFLTDRVAESLRILNPKPSDELSAAMSGESKIERDMFKGNCASSSASSWPAKGVWPTQAEG